MAEEIAKFDPASLGDKLKDRIKNSIADLIPEDTWIAMMQKEIDSFFKETVVTKDRWGDHTSEPGTFRKVFREVMTEVTRKHLVEFLNGPEFQPVWSNVGMLAGEGVKKMATEAAPAIVESLLSSALQQFVINLRNNVPR